MLLFVCFGFKRSSLRVQLLIIQRYLLPTGKISPRFNEKCRKLIFFYKRQMTLLFLIIYSFFWFILCIEYVHCHLTVLVDSSIVTGCIEILIVGGPFFSCNETVLLIWTSSGLASVVVVIVSSCKSRIVFGGVLIMIVTRDILHLLDPILEIFSVFCSNFAC